MVRWMVYRMVRWMADIVGRMANRIVSWMADIVGRMFSRIVGRMTDWIVTRILRWKPIFVRSTKVILVA